MTGTHIIRIPRTDEEGTFLLVQVTSTGSKTLDLKLVATEGFSPFVVKSAVRHDRVSTLKTKNSPCSEDEWERFLAAILRDREPTPDIEAVAHVVEEKDATVTVRRRVQGITQRLGTFTLKYDDSQDIELFDWCSTALAAREKDRVDLVSAAAKTKELESAVAELKAQLEELVEAKQSDQSELLEKFCRLLNEKKVKIREQQRLIATSSSKAAPVQDALLQDGDAMDEDTGSGHAPKASRSSKRKAAQAVEADESDEAPENAEVSKNQGEEEESEGQETSDPEETGSEPDEGAAEDKDEEGDGGDGDDDDDDQPQPAGRRSKVSSPPAQGPAASTRHAASSKKKGPAAAPPPKRSLPFGLGKSKPSGAPDPGTDTDDDEL